VCVRGRDGADGLVGGEVDTVRLGEGPSVTASLFRRVWRIGCPLSLKHPESQKLQNEL